MSALTESGSGKSAVLVLIKAIPIVSSEKALLQFFRFEDLHGEMKLIIVFFLILLYLDV